jgi:hypothetical protein
MVDRRVGLDRVDEVEPRRERLDLAPRRGDDPDRQRVLVAERAPDRSDRRTDDDPRRVAERHRRERVLLRVDPEHADVVEEVVADDLGREALAVLELDVDLLRRRGIPLLVLPGGRDHVGIREDDAVLRDDEAGALARARVRRRRAVEEREDRHDPGRARAVDLRGLEPVADERLRDHDRGGLARVADRLADDDRPRRVVPADPAGRLPDHEHGGGAEDGGDERDQGDGTGAELQGATHCSHPCRFHGKTPRATRTASRARGRRRRRSGRA